MSAVGRWFLAETVAIQEQLGRPQMAKALSILGVQPEELEMILRCEFRAQVLTEIERHHPKMAKDSTATVLAERRKK